MNENYLLGYPKMVLSTGNRWRSNAGEGRATFIAKDDSARVAAALLLGKGQNNMAYNVTGESISEREICKLVAEKLRIDIEYVPLGDEAFIVWMESIGIPRDMSGDFSRAPIPWSGTVMATNKGSVKNNSKDVKADTVKNLTGRNPLTVRDLVNVYADTWVMA